jgi:hypothetical protein
MEAELLNAVAALITAIATLALAINGKS